MTNLQDIKKSLAPFLRNNKNSKISRFSDPERGFFAIEKPWSDESLLIEVGEDTDLVNALNDIELPDRLSAIYHRSDKSLEILWSAYNPTEAGRTILGRKFKYKYDSKFYDCEFADASKTALLLSSNYHQIAASDTGYRNLPSFRHFQQFGEDGTPFSKPRSFWIKKISFRNDDLVQFVRRLNFYISYYDSFSPTVLIHPPEIEKHDQGQIRFSHKRFPKTIQSAPISDELLHFWSASKSGDPAQQFLYSYRIVEHAAHFFVDSAPRSAVKKVLKLPHALDNIENCVDQVVAAVQSAKLDDYQRIDALIKSAVDPEHLWPLIKNYHSHFSSELIFSGGFKLNAIINGERSKADFCVSGLNTLSTTLRKIRNALSHGKDQKTSSVISPTSENFHRLKPWSELMQRIAGDVIINNSDDLR